MEEVRIKLSALWVCLMLTYFLGDVLRVFSGDFEAGEIAGMTGSQEMFLAAAIVLLIPIIMVFLSLTVKYPLIRWATIILAVFFFAFNLVGFSGYPGLYDRFLLAVSFVFNAVTVWYAWRWRKPVGVAQ